MIETMPELMRLYNRSQKTQVLNVRGKQFTIDGFEEKTFEEEIARLFVSSTGGIVVEAEGLLAKNIEPAIKPETMWIANMTGNPETPKKIKQRVYRGKNAGWAMEEMENPSCKAAELSQTIPGGWFEYTDKFGQTVAGKKPPIKIVLPPYKRIEVVSTIGSNVLARLRGSTAVDSDGTKYPKVARCRAPMADEPTMSWGLDRLQNWLIFVDPRVVVEDSEERIKTKHKKESAARIAFAIDEVKRRAYKRVFFRLIDPTIKIPSRQAFEEFMGVAKSEPVDTLAEDILSELEMPEVA